MAAAYGAQKARFDHGIIQDLQRIPVDKLGKIPFTVVDQRLVKADFCPGSMSSGDPVERPPDFTLIRSPPSP